MDRDGGSGDTPLDKAKVGFAFLVCAGNHPRRVSERLGKRHKTVGMWAHQMISLVRRWLASPLHQADGRYRLLCAGTGPACQCSAGDGCLTTGRLDAVRHSPPPERTRHTIGRPRVGGLRLPALEQVLQDPETVWQKLTLDWYGEGERTLEICTGTALWYRYGSDPLPIRWVLTRDPSGKRPPKAIFSTDPTQPAEQIISDEISRSRLEVTFEESRAHLGIETQRQWSDLALSARLLCSLASTASSLSLGKHCILMAAFLSLKQPGIASRLLHSVMFLLSSGDRCGARGLFPHHPLIPLWF